MHEGQRRQPSGAERARLARDERSSTHLTPDQCLYHCRGSRYNLIFQSALLSKTRGRGGRGAEPGEPRHTAASPSLEPQPSGLPSRCASPSAARGTDTHIRGTTRSRAPERPRDGGRRGERVRRGRATRPGPCSGFFKLGKRVSQTSRSPSRSTLTVKHGYPGGLEPSSGQRPAPHIYAHRRQKYTRESRHDRLLRPCALASQLRGERSPVVM